MQPPMIRTRRRPTGRRTATASVVAAIIAASVGLTAAASPVRAGTTITVTTTEEGVNSDAECSLQEAIYAANLDASEAPDPAHPDDPNAFIPTACAAGNGTDVIELPAGALFTMAGPTLDASNPVGPTATPLVSSTIVIEAHGAHIRHGGGETEYRAFAVGSSGDLTIHEAWISGFEVHGGNGMSGGGGGMGAGGAIYVVGGALSVGWSTFSGNGALGGNGSDGNFGGGGGGGGLGGNGGAGQTGGGGGGGGGGSLGAGAPGVDLGCPTICPGGSPGGGGGGTVADAFLATGGVTCGGDGSDGFFDLLVPFDRDGEDGQCAGGGGGGGQEASILGVGGIYGGDGGDGAYGGGGGGGAYLYESGDGGAGGFGGGGGGTNTSGSNVLGIGPSGGNGGFGGGGGAGSGGYLPLVGGGPGAGGAFAGDGSGSAGGGGAGLGGAIFGHAATIVIRNSTFEGNYANRGHSGGEGANDGRGAGGAIFIDIGSLTINSSTFADNQTGEYPDGAFGKVGGGGIVVYRPDGSGNATSFTMRNTLLVGNGPNHECYTKNGPTTAGSNNLIIEGSKPDGDEYGDCPGIALTADPLLHSLALNAPGTTPTMKLAGASVAIDAADPGTSEPDDQRGIARPQGGAPDIGAYEASSLPPMTTITLDPAAPDGLNGWYVNPVAVAITATDPDGSVAQTRCALDPATTPATFDDLPDAACDLTSVAADGSHTIYAASSDTDGNVEPTLASVGLSLDVTAPILSPTLNVATPVVVGQTGVVVSPNASDATSGLAGADCGALDTSSPGVQTVTCSATDNAGNTGTADLVVVVEYRILGFFSPVPLSRWKVGQSVPIKVALGDADGNRISDVEAAALAADCRVTFTASGAQTKGPECLKYDPLMDQFIYTWKLGKKDPGAATIAVAISYPGSAVVTQLDESITIMH